MARWIPALVLVASLNGGAVDFRPLFNGRDLDGWTFLSNNGTPGFTVVDGELRTTGGPGLLWYTREKFANSVVRVVYKVAAREGNSGVFIRIPGKPESERAAANAGIEVQIDEHDDDWHCTGTLYSLTQAKARPSRPPGEWNVMEITLDGLRTRIAVNGVLVTDYDGVSPVPERRKAYEPDRGPRTESGYIGLQNHDARTIVSFREVSVRKLP